MPEDYSQYQLVFITLSRPEAYLAQGMLEEMGIKSRLKQDMNTETLSITRGSAVMPFEKWGVYVPAVKKAEAEEILGELLQGQASNSAKESPVRKAAKMFIWIYLLGFIILIVLGLWFAINYISQSKQL